MAEVSAELASRTPKEEVPIVFDLDRTLLKTDLLHEGVFTLIRRAPMSALKIPLWMLRGRAYLKHRIAELAGPDWSTLPVNDEIQQLAEARKAAGQAVYVATASTGAALTGLRGRFPFVDGVFSSDQTINLKGETKARFLRAQFPAGFEYVGDSSSDIPVWRSATTAFIYSNHDALPRAVQQSGKPVELIRPPTETKGVLRSLRLHQWMKNLLVFVPLFLGDKYHSADSVIASLFAFIGLSLVASGTYVFNDLLDLENDRKHWSKRLRPLASGRLPIADGAVLSILTVAAGLGVSAFGAPAAAPWILLYLVTTMLYSTWLKRVEILDCFGLASLFTLRLAIGTVASAALPSPWLFTFSMFVFGSLSLAKRNTEIIRSSEKQSGQMAGRGYRQADAPIVLGLGLSLAMCAVLVNVLYLVNDAFSKAFYSSISYLWIFPGIIFLFLSRIWLVSQRGELNDDPTIFAAKDPLCQLLAVTLVLSLLAARFV